MCGRSCASRSSLISVACGAGSATADASSPSTAACRAGEHPHSTHRSRRWFLRRTTGLPWNLTFADAAAKVRRSGSGRSRVAIISRATPRLKVCIRGPRTHADDPEPSVDAHIRHTAELSLARRRALKGIVILARRMDWWADDSVVVLRWAQLSFPLAIRRLDCNECSQQLGDRLGTPGLLESRPRWPTSNNSPTAEAYTSREPREPAMRA